MCMFTVVAYVFVVNFWLLSVYVLSVCSLLLIKFYSFNFTCILKLFD